MAEPVQVIGFSGSLRQGSLNTALLRQLGELSPEIALTIGQYRDLPHYDADLGTVPGVEALKKQVRSADAVLIVTPEYNYSVPGALKNALDWLSRPAFQSVFAGKPVGVLSVSPGAVGGARAQAHLKNVLLGMAAQVFPHPDVAIGAARERIQDGRIVQEDTRILLERYSKAFVDWTRRVVRVGEP